MTLQASRSRPANIVLVEDDIPTALLTIALLEEDGAQVSHFVTAEAARTHLAAGMAPDVVLTDLHLPGESGLDLTRWLRSDPDRATMPIVLITIAGEREVRLRALDEGADDLLTKPVQPVELRARVRSLTRLSRARTQLDVRERLDAVVSRVSDGVAVLNSDGSARSVNERASQLLALSPEMLAGTGGLLEDVESRFEVVRRCAATADTDETIELHRPRVGSEQPLWLLLTLLPVPHDPDGGTVVVVRDVTDERAATAIADVVLSSVAHKLRTPLTGIVSALPLLRQALAGGPYEQILDMMGRNAVRLDDSLAAILDHAAGVSGGVEELPLSLTATHAVEELSEELTANAAAALRAGGVELDGDVDIPLTPVVSAIEEFVANAIRSGDPLPVASVTVRCGQLEVTVEDRGPGFPPEDAQRLFSPFFQADRTGQSPGMGLGLPLVHHLVAQVGGTMSATSPAGGPTTFGVCLPVRRSTSNLGRDRASEAA